MARRCQALAHFKPWIKQSVMTGKVIRGADAPVGGLKKSVPHREVPLTIEDF